MERQRNETGDIAKTRRTQQTHGQLTCSAARPFLLSLETGKVDWADDFDDLPAAPLTRPDRGIPRRGDDWLSSMPDRADRDRALSATRGGPGPGAGGSIGFDRGSFPPREELPLPTNPPYTAFVGNLAFDLTDGDVEEFFAPNKVGGGE